MLLIRVLRLWPSLEVRHLLALAAVTETGTFSRAAEELGYTQSAVSQQIGALERIVGTPVFERPRTSPRPAHARRRDSADACPSSPRPSQLRFRRPARLAGGERGELRVGIMPSVGAKGAPQLLATFRADWPGIQVVLRESREFTDLIHAVESGDIDVTFTDIGPYETRPLTVRHLLDDPLVFLAPANAPEATQQVVSIADIAHLPMIGTATSPAGRSSTRLSAVRPSHRPTSSAPTTTRPSKV